MYLKHEKIYVITNKKYFENFHEFQNKIFLINIDDLEETYNYYDNSKLDTNFRNGFWMLSSYRFFYIYSLMKKYNLENVIHIENDVLLYYNCDILNDILNKEFIYLPFDTYKRNISSIMYIPSHIIFKKILDNYSFNFNDMENFYYIKEKIGHIDNFPIFINKNFQNNEINFVSKNFEKFNYIFDAAAIGQYLGGVDPRNISGNTITVSVSSGQQMWQNNTGVVGLTITLIRGNSERFIWRSLWYGIP